jgi:hypothetical protein
VLKRVKETVTVHNTTPGKIHFTFHVPSTRLATIECDPHELVLLKVTHLFCLSLFVVLVLQSLNCFFFFLNVLVGYTFFVKFEVVLVFTTKKNTFVILTIILKGKSASVDIYLTVVCTTTLQDFIRVEMQPMALCAFLIVAGKSDVSFEIDHKEIEVKKRRKETRENN